jgi:thymidylate synthase
MWNWRRLAGSNSLTQEPTPTSFLSAETLDDLMRSVIESVQRDGRPITASRGPMMELTGVLLELVNPRARLSLTESRGKPFSCLGELCWYLAASDEVEFIAYYLRRYREEAQDGVIFGAYGPRLFNLRGVDQLTNVTALLRNSSTTRRAVIQLFEATDVVARRVEVPCTCTLQFLLREGRLHLMVSMRSNDVILGLPHDVFCFTMIQEMVARELSVDVGGYKHAVGSLHLYDSSSNEAREFMDEGFQSTDMPMPNMPEGNPKDAVAALLRAEAEIRTVGTTDESGFRGLDVYWQDLIRLLQVYGYAKARRIKEIESLQSQISFSGYHPFIENQLRKLR